MSPRIHPPGGASINGQHAQDWLVADTLVVEDDRHSAALMASILDGVSRRVTVADTALGALDLLAESPFDLITLDVGLPDLSGLELLRHVREITAAPVIMVTALDQSSTIVEALQSGADDYLVKPVRPAEVRARILALTRRMHAHPSEVERYADPQIVVDFARSMIIRSSGASSTLSATERRLLRELATRPGSVLTHDELIQRVWGAGYEGTSANLHVFISYLRKKLNDPADPHQYIQTRRGIGYEFVPSGQSATEQP